MEKYYKIINEIESIRGLKNAFTVYCMKYTASIILNFYNMKAFRILDNEDSKMFEKFKLVIDYNDVNYEFKTYGAIEIYF